MQWFGVCKKRKIFILACAVVCRDVATAHAQKWLFLRAEFCDYAYIKLKECSFNKKKQGKDVKLTHCNKSLLIEIVKNGLVYSLVGSVADPRPHTTVALSPRGEQPSLAVAG